MKNIVGKLRKESLLSQEELAKILEISRPGLSNIERGKVVPRIRLIFKIANYFGMPAEQIFFESAVQQNEQKPNEEHN